MPGITWDAEADRKILLAVLKDPSASANVDWDALAAELTTDAATCTVAALKKHTSRIRVAAKNDNDPKTPAPKKGKAKSNGYKLQKAAPGQEELKIKAENSDAEA
ncbi:unnamed protein product [Aureobasidium vineae]|uniref:Myb-like domain-containing protein n=1 Tax=Aureobasidium vineae TaxID=2773715 RepID=A0A9N8JJM9_9PEZI|nr:unnamed protein product [Aureobasidium vineae]